MWLVSDSATQQPHLETCTNSVVLSARLGPAIYLSEPGTMSSRRYTVRGSKSHQGIPPLLQLFLTPVPHSARIESSSSPLVLGPKGSCNLPKRKGAGPAHSTLAHVL